jgi:hypothetical protein
MTSQIAALKSPPVANNATFSKDNGSKIGVVTESMMLALSFLSMYNVS